MSTKYDAPEIRSELIDHLAQLYPDTLSAYERRRLKDLFSEDDFPVDQDFWLLSLAKRCDARILLPALFYSCAIQPLDDILNSSAIIEQEDFNTIISGRERMMKGSYEVATLALLQGKKCRSNECAVLRSSLVVGHIDFKTYTPPPFPLQVSHDGALPVDAAVRANLCKTCVTNYRDALKSNRKRFWKDLPGIFNLGNWDEVRQEMEET